MSKKHTIGWSRIFLEMCLKHMSFHDKWELFDNAIRHDSHISVKFNEEPLEIFQPAQGLQYKVIPSFHYCCEHVIQFDF